MTVKDLREALADLPNDMPVFVDGYESGLHDLESVEVTPVALKGNDDLYGGPHKAHPNGVLGLVLPRPS